MRTTTTSSGSDSLPAILCLHGGGASGAILSVQAFRLRSRLRDHFSFIFVDAPFPAIAGPGILPTFEGSEPFLQWFDPGNATPAQRASEIQKLELVVRTAYEKEDQSHARREIVGILGFSQGAVAATWLLLQREQGRLPWFKPRFAVLVCGDFGELSGPQDEAERSSSASMVSDLKITLPSIHIHGIHDPVLPRSKLLLKQYYHEDMISTMEFKGAHHFPLAVEENELAATMIIAATQTPGVRDLTGSVGAT